MMFRFFVICAALLVLAGCAGRLEQMRSVQQAAHGEKVKTMGVLLDAACDGLLVTDVVSAMTARPNLRAGLPLVCPHSVGALMGLAAEGPPSTVRLEIEIVDPDAPVPPE